jgi:chromosome segregation ATPase
MFACLVSSSYSDTTEQYSLTVLPDENSQLVRQQSVFDVNELVKSVRHLSSHSDMAYYATVAYKAVTSFQDKALGIYQDVKQMNEKSRSVFNDFNLGSKVVLEDLKRAYNHLSNNEKDEADGIIKGVSRKASDFAIQSEELYREAENSREKVRGVLTDVFNSKDDQNKQKSAITGQIQSLEANKARVMAEKDNAQRSAAESRRNADQARQDADNEKKKKKKKCKGIFGKVKCAFTKDKVKKYEKRERSYRDEERKHLDQLRAHENKYREAEAALNQVTSKLNELQNQIRSLDETANGLQQLINEYNSVTVGFQEYHAYWKDMSNRCQSLQTDASKEQLTSLSFQREAVEVYVQWLALQRESQLYLDLAKNVPNSLPGKTSADEARAKMKLIKDEL